MTRQRFRMRRFTWLLMAVVLLLLVLAILPQVSGISGQLLIWANITVALLGLAAGLMVIRHVNHRLAQLADVARSLEQGDYSARAEVTDSDAIGLLARTINAMAEKIQFAIRELEVQRHDLERSKKMLAEKNASLEHQFRRQAAFGEYLAALNAVDAKSVAGTTLAYMAEEADIQLGVFYLWDKKLNQLTPVAELGIDHVALAKLAAVDLAHGFPGQVMNERRWLTVRDMDEEALPAIQLGFAEARLRTIVGIPVLFQQSVLGVIVLAALHQIADPARRMLESAVDALGSALNSALSYNMVQQQAMQLEQINRELIEADRLRSEFVANMNHELRTPLNSIIGFSGLLQKNREGTLTKNDLNYLEKIHRNGKHLLNLINDILDLSKIEADRMDLLIRTVPVEAVVQEVIDMLKPQADEKSLHITLDAPTILPPIQTDSEKLKRALINLVGNALKFTHQGGIRVRLCKDEQHPVKIEIRDTGIGIPQDKLESIFEPFRQVDSSTSREYGGTGLGLAITRSIVELLNGSISVSSELGRGTTFTLTLPATQDSNCESAPNRQEPDEPVKLQEVLNHAR